MPLQEDHPSRPCPCVRFGGLPTENCFRCFGSGELAAGGDATSAIPSSNPAVPLNDKIRRKTLHSPAVPPQDSSAKGIGIRENPQWRPLGSEPRNRCPICYALLQSRQIIRHFKKAHKLGPTALVLCPTCNTQVAIKYLGQHLAKACHLSKPRASQSKRPAPNSRTAGTPELTSGTTLGHDSPGLDVTRDYAQRFRDHGQFGSHPSHDGFDDESKP